MLKDQILETKPVYELAVPQWGFSVYVKKFGLDSLINSKPSDDEKIQIGQTLVKGLCDENGNCLFTEADIPELMKKDWAALMLIIKKITEINGELGDFKPDDFQKPVTA